MSINVDKELDSIMNSAELSELVSFTGIKSKNDSDSIERLLDERLISYKQLNDTLELICLTEGCCTFDSTRDEECMLFAQAYFELMFDPLKTVISALCPDRQSAAQLHMYILDRLDYPEYPVPESHRALVDALIAMSGYKEGLGGRYNSKKYLLLLISSVVKEK